MKKYFSVWWVASRASTYVAFTSRLGAVLILVGKLVRFAVFFLFLVALSYKTQAILGYSPNQVIFFYLTFNIVDVITQMIFREVYRFRPQIVEGAFDLILSRPVNPLFRALLGGIDILDLITLPPLIVLTVYYGIFLHPSLVGVGLYLLLLVNAFVIAAAFHIAVLALGILTTAIDHTIMIYRDVTNLGRIPIDFYREPVRGVLTFAIPVAIMMTVPAKVFMGIFDLKIIVYGFVIAAVFLFAALEFWHWALKSYTSASS